jgi:hypothetical protein
MADSIKEHEKEILRRQQDPRFSRPGRGTPEQKKEAERMRQAIKECEEQDSNKGTG